MWGNTSRPVYMQDFCYRKPLLPSKTLIFLVTESEGLLTETYLIFPVFTGTTLSWFAPHMDTMIALNLLAIFPCHFFLKGASFCGDALGFESSAVTHVPYVKPDTAAPAVNASPVLKSRSEGNNRDWQYCFSVTAYACTVSCSWKWASPKILLLPQWKYHKGDDY